jgi:hypothetical protein
LVIAMSRSPFTDLVIPVSLLVPIRTLVLTISSEIPHKKNLALFVVHIL